MKKKELDDLVARYKDRLLKIKVCAFDVDGILTDSRVMWDGEEVGWNRCTNTRDGYGLKLLKKFGFKVGVITGGDSLSVKKRFKENLKLDFVYSGKEDKRYAFNDLMEQGYKAEEILYMGDEFFDAPLLKRAGFSATVPSASFEIQEVADYVTKLDSGKGCAREVIEILRHAHGKFPEVIDFDGNPMSWKM